MNIRGLLLAGLIGFGRLAILPGSHAAPAQASPPVDWLLDPSSYKARVTEDKTKHELVLSNGLARRVIRLAPNAATIELTNLTSGEQMLRAVGPEAKVTINRIEYAIGGLEGQTMKNCLTADELSHLHAAPAAYMFSEWSQEPIAPRFGWKKHPDWLAKDLPWPPPGRHVVMRYVPPSSPPMALQGRVLLEDSFAGRLNPAWKTHVSDLHPRASFSNEGKAGEIYAPPDTAVYAERAWPTGAASIEVTLDAGDDTLSNAWGPGLALAAPDRLLAFIVRPNQRSFEINGQTMDTFDRDKPCRLRVRLRDGRAFCEASQDDKNFRLIASVEFPKMPTHLRVGKVGQGGHGVDLRGAKGDKLVRCHITHVTARSAEPAGQGGIPRADLPNVEVHYEIYDGIPLFSKWVVVKNGTDKTLRVNHFVSEELRLFEVETKGGSLTGRVGTEQYFPNLYVETDMAFGGRMSAFDDNHAVYWTGDPDYHTHVNYQYAPPYFLQCKPCAFRQPGRPSIGPDQDVAAAGSFETFRAFELLLDSSERERRTLAQRRMYRVIAPWTAENPLMFHKVNSDAKSIRAAIEQAHEVGFEMIIMSFGSGFNFESTDPKYRAVYKDLAAEAKAKGIALGGYSLLASRSSGDPKQDTYGAPAFYDVMPCLGAAWGQRYLRNIGEFLRESGLTVFENDGSYPGDFCAATDHPGHHGLEDSQWVMWRAITDFYKQCCSEGVFLNVPDWYFLSGSNKCGMGYRESNWSLPRDQQEIIERQNIFDGTWTKTASMGWMMVPLTQYHGGGGAATIEPLNQHLEHYETRFANLLGAGVQACYRGPRLYDTDETKALVKKWVTFYKQHREVLDADLIHLRRASGRDWDGWLHVNPQGKEKGLVFFYNPLPEPIEQEIRVPLYYTGLVDKANVSVEGAAPTPVTLDRTSTATLNVRIPAHSRTWLIFTPAP
ncbi:MAG: hypothetical protein K8T25_15245 [Planctomycetia bacterium]|nr:hypothetical protein [Planctomycetia bacterium]